MLIQDQVKLVKIEAKDEVAWCESGTLDKYSLKAEVNILFMGSI